MSKVRMGWAVGVAMALSLSLGVTSGFAESAKTAPAAKKPKPPVPMVVNGISSGVMRLPKITIWECPGGAQGGCNPIGEVKHGTKVMRVKIEKARGLKWALIKGEGIEGWIRKELLKRPGT